MVEEVKYLDYLGLSLYDELTKKYIDNKDYTLAVENEQISGHDTIVIVPGSYNPSTGVKAKTTLKVNIDNNSIIFKNVAGTYSAAEAEAYNQANPEATPVAEGDQKPADYRLAVADSALVQYIGGDGINISNPINGEKTVSAVVKTGDKVLAVDANGLNTTINITKLTPAAYDAETGHSTGDFATRFGANVKEAYILTGINGEQIGTDSDAISVYKDSSLQNVAFVTVDDQGNVGQYLKFSYTLADGTTQDTYLDVSTIIVESEAGDGLAVADSKDQSGNKALKVKIDSTSEADGDTTPVPFLTVSSNGIKLQGIKAEIAREIDAIGSDTVNSGKIITGIAIDSSNGIVITDDAYIPVINAPVNKVNNSAPAAGTPETLFSTITIDHNTTDSDDYTITHNIKTLPVNNATAAVLYTAEDDEVIAGTKQVGEVKTQAVDGLVTALDAKTFIESTVINATSFITNTQITGLFSGILSASEIAAIEANHIRA